MRSGKLYYIQTVAYIVITIDGKTITRRAYDIDKANKTANIRLKGEIKQVDYHY